MSLTDEIVPVGASTLKECVGKVNKYRLIHHSEMEVTEPVEKVQIPENLLKGTHFLISSKTD